VRALRAFAVDLNENGRADEAAEVIDRAIAVAPTAKGLDKHFMAYLYQISGLVQVARLQPERALQDNLKGIEIDERAFGPRSILRPYLEGNLAKVAVTGPDWKAAAARAEAVLADVEKAPLDPRNAPFLHGSLVQVYLRTGDVPAAQKMLALAVPAYHKAFPKPSLANVLSAGVEIELLAGNELAARVYFDELQALRRGPLAGNPGIEERADDLEARLLLARNDPEPARALLAARVGAIARAEPKYDPLRHANVELVLAEAEEKAGQAAAAEKRARALLASIEPRKDRAWFAETEALASRRVASALAAQARAAEATPFRERAASLLAERQVPSSPRLALKK